MKNPQSESENKSLYTPHMRADVNPMSFAENQNKK